MSEELRFIDPAFACEVVLSGSNKALYDAARYQFDRLKGIKSLGVISHVSDIAIHTKHYHLIGLMRIFNKLEQQPKRRGLPKDFLWSFWCRLCFGQVGHAAFTYDAERAVLLACHIDPNFKDKLRIMLQPVAAQIIFCPKCTKDCSGKNKDANAAPVWLEDMIQKNQWRRLYLWVAAVKLIQESRILAILNGQNNPGNGNGFSQAEAFKMLVNPECEWNHTFKRLSRLDYVVRDLAFAGTLGIQLDIDNLVSQADKDHPDWNLLQSLHDHLFDNLYETKETQTTSVLFQRAVADLLIKGRLTLEQLFGTDRNSALLDEDLKRLLRKTRVGREFLGQEYRDGWHTWQIDADTDEDSTPYEVETAITGQKRLHLTNHITSRVTCIKMAHYSTLGLAICHRGHDDRPTATNFVKLCRSVLIGCYPNLNSEKLMTALYEGLVDITCNSKMGIAEQRFSELPIEIDLLKRAASVVMQRAQVNAPLPTGLTYKIGGTEYPFRGAPDDDLMMILMHAAIKGDDTVRKNLLFELKDASELLWSEILRWQTIYLGRRPLKSIINLVDNAQEKLRQGLTVAGANRSRDLELYTFLEALKHPKDSVSFRITLPNLILVKDDRTIENEYDVVSIVLKDNRHVEVWIWGVTTETDIARKRREDHDKIQRLKDRLGNRWGGEIRTVENYVYIDGDYIRTEINGIQTRISIIEG